MPDATPIKTKLDVDPDRDPEAFNTAIAELVLEDDIMWAYHMIPYVKSEDDVFKYMAQAPSPGAISMLTLAHKNQMEFMKNHVPKALGRKKKETVLVDDGRKTLERIDQAVAFFNEAERNRAGRN